MKPFSILLLLGGIAVVLSGCSRGDAAGTNAGRALAKKGIPPPADIRPVDSRKANSSTPSNGTSASKAKTPGKGSGDSRASKEPVRVLPWVAQGGSNIAQKQPERRQPVLLFDGSNNRTPVAARRIAREPKAVKWKSPTLPSGLPSWFKEWDRDRDGQVGLYECPNEELDKFTRYDRNHDGFVTASEVAVIDKIKTSTAASSSSSTPAAPAASTSSPSTASSSGTTSAGSSSTPSTSSASSSAKPTATTPASSASPMIFTFGSSSGRDSDRRSEGMMRSDKNGDGKLTKDEFRFGTEVFDKWDSNKDGSLTPEEITANMQNQRMERIELRRP